MLLENLFINIHIKVLHKTLLELITHSQTILKTLNMNMIKNLDI